ncbi:uncharacterized protein RMCC_0099 [Mycolicibacterium canariasense]|uniref:Uncharacterized protein n=1 Tax=Mycolicibacterium canariasense TaxID=228230 RepID=A0A100W7T8_MYCCR|nr:hypothetical protein [Mycolicibacterium canariasense]MCV7210988.1 hypothetical protein [Mycolicibacterium canariasense]ORV01404.1 hypothetical protein AWB94_25990 [Mycolicibacterium canariasense]GAS93133.1 uncharacterized protein RMCC_0099 [Mycolicibacterium canariasense]
MASLADYERELIKERAGLDAGVIPRQWHKVWEPSRPRVALLGPVVGEPVAAFGCRGTLFGIGERVAVGIVELGAGGPR